MKTVVSAGGVVFKKRENGVSVLLIRDRFGQWTLPKGKRETGETTEETALREIREETGIIGNIVGPLQWIEYTFADGGKERACKQVHYYLVEAFDDFLQVQQQEICDASWFSPEEAWNLQLQDGYRNNDEVLRQALQQLGFEVKRN